MEKKAGDIEFSEISQADYSKLATTLTKIGYKDGIAEGRDAVFQNGFDIGYSDGFRTSFEIIKWKTIRNLSDQQHEEPSKTLHPVLDAPERNHHIHLNVENKSVDDISRLQNQYLSQITLRLKKDYDKADKLLD